MKRITKEQMQMPHEGSNLTEEKIMEAVKLLADLYMSELAIVADLAPVAATAYGLLEGSGDQNSSRFPSGS